MEKKDQRGSFFDRARDRLRTLAHRARRSEPERDADAFGDHERDRISLTEPGEGIAHDEYPPRRSYGASERYEREWREPRGFERYGTERRGRDRRS